MVKTGGYILVNLLIMFISGYLSAFYHDIMEILKQCCTAA